ncbi:hypothetical protein Mapa_008392 [Marchantia paleacea]|nr:hypothetical protein Mapa_008392 [Marchantia paleacea]
MMLLSTIVGKDVVGRGMTYILYRSFHAEMISPYLGSMNGFGAEAESLCGIQQGLDFLMIWHSCGKNEGGDLIA